MTLNYSCLALLSCLTLARVARAETFAYAPRGDGQIAAYRVSRTGALEPISNPPLASGNRRLALVPSADKRFLYVYPEFNIGKDGYDPEEIGDKKRVYAAGIKPTPITVFAIGSNGALRRLQTVSVPSPVGQLVARPSGTFVYALTATQGAYTLRTNPDGTLKLVGRSFIVSGMGLANVPGERDIWDISFSPNGTYLYDFGGDGFIDHAENYLHRYRVNPATGLLTSDGKPWNNSGEKSNRVALDPGMVRGVVHKTAFVEGFGNGLWVCRVDDAGRILSVGSRIALGPKNRTDFVSAQVLIKHPKLPVVIYRANPDNPYTVWRVTAPGKLTRVATFRSAFKEKESTDLYTDPAGRFLYEVQTPYAERTARTAVFAWDKTGARVTPIASPRALANEGESGLVFIAPPPK